MRRGLVASAVVLVAGLTPGLASPVDSCGTDNAGAVNRHDFDGDGYADLAVGVAGEDLRGVLDAGAVQVLYGGQRGLTARDQIWHQGRRGVKGTLEADDRFGSALASGDFDGDGFADLAIGTPFEDVRRVTDAGAVQVLYGSKRGLTARDQIWHHGTSGVPGDIEVGGLFGWSLATGDFDADGYSDLAIGAPVETVGGARMAGQVVVLSGGRDGLSSSRAQLLHQGSGGIPSRPQPGEGFGTALAVGDANGDGHDDLAIGVDLEMDAMVESAVHVVYGGRAGLALDTGQYVLSRALEVTGSQWTLAFGDFNKDGRSDLAFGIGDLAAVVHGRPEGLRPAALPLSSTVPPGVDARWEAGGASQVRRLVATGDINCDGHLDLAAAIDGGIALIPGGVGGLLSEPGVRALPVTSVDAMASLGLNGSQLWLVVGENGPEGGSIGVFPCTAGGALGPVEMWSQDSLGVKGRAEPGDGFGSSIAG